MIFPSSSVTAVVNAAVRNSSFLLRNTARRCCIGQHNFTSVSGSITGNNSITGGTMTTTTTTTIPYYYNKSQEQQVRRTIFNVPDYTNDESIIPLTKIVATIGPTSEQEIPIQTVTNAGMNIMRLNFSHATKDEVSLRIKNINIAQSVLYNNNKNFIGILLDTKGPEIRTGKLSNDTSGHDTITLQQGNTITIHTNSTTECIKNGSTIDNLFIDFQHLSQVVKKDSTILLDDGAIILTVTNTSNMEHGTVTCIIQNTATLRSRAGVNLPYADISQHSLPALSDKDKADILYGMNNDVDIDYIAASFVQTGQGVIDIRNYIEECAKKLNYTTNQPRPLIISKIETGSGLQNFNDILHHSDAIMVARGDLGVEIPLQQVTNAQKQMISLCNDAGKPVIVATQMLESMTKNPRPTRAEVADVTNAVYDGADAVMTSGETAKGKYPADTIKFMSSILKSTEQFMINDDTTTTVQHPFTNNIANTSNTAVGAVAAAAVTAANRMKDCQAIIIMNVNEPPQLQTIHTNITTLIASYRPTNVPIIPVCTTTKIARQLTLYRAIKPILTTSSVDETNTMDVVQRAKELYNLQSGKPFVLVNNTTSTSKSSILEIGTIP